ncbi:hypothetical protein ABS71_10595 [bacterium SCN 62-11]|nr:MAG: hypothetical protein ABS71_10595 [bacterium SCN 62-11]
MDFLHSLKTSFLQRFGRAAFFLASLTVLFGLVAVVGSGLVALLASTHQGAVMPFLKPVIQIWAIWMNLVIAKVLLLTLWDVVSALIRGNGKTQ